MLKLIFYGLIFALTQPVFAKAAIYSGLIQKDSSGKIYLTDKSRTTPYEIESLYTSTKEQLDRLKTNDFISIQADVGLTENTLLIYSINFVGLSDLLGLWKSDEENCYFFDSFNTLKVYAASTNSKCEMPYLKSVKKRIRSFSYFINPGVTNWYMVISDNRTSLAAELVMLIPQTSIQLRLFDDMTGDVLSILTLRR